MTDFQLKKSDFGTDFIWGAATAAYQIEGEINKDGKSKSVWDVFSHTKRKIKTGENADIACDYYNKFDTYHSLVKEMNLNAFRFSLSWPRIIPQGVGQINQKGIDFYHRVIDNCLEKNIEPWITLYHWDLPQILEEKGGWTNRDIVFWFQEYVDKCTQIFGDKVKNWMILNEPFAFTALGYLLSIHAPGKKGISSFMAAVHHATLCQSLGGRIAKANVSGGKIGTTFSCSPNHPLKNTPSHIKAAQRFDAIQNRLFIEPAVGLGYPTERFGFLKRLEKYIKSGDEELVKFDFDFIGIQTYTREIVKSQWFIPYIQAKQIPAAKRKTDCTEMGWEVYPPGIYEMLKQFAEYKNVKTIYVTENGAAFKDTPINGRVHDKARVLYFRNYLKQVYKAKNEGVPVKGYFVWSLMDNFEWAEGYRPRFGLVYIDFKTLEPIIKDSGFWFKDFLAE